MRLFIAIDPPPALQETLADLAFPHPHMRWSNAEQLHLTLAFLGDQSPDRFEPLCDALTQVTVHPFTLITAGAGCFAQGAIWLGLQHNTELIRLQKQICRAVSSSGIRFQQRRFHPHITLGRCRINPALITEQLQHRLQHQQFQFEIDRFVLKSSTLRQDGAVHCVEAEFFS